MSLPRSRCSTSRLGISTTQWTHWPRLGSDSRGTRESPRMTAESIASTARQLHGSRIPPATSCRSWRGKSLSACEADYRQQPRRQVHNWSPCDRGCPDLIATVGPMRVATWNVNSVKQRVPRLLPWLEQRQPDVVCLQETKLADDAFVELLGDELSRRGYMTAHHGEAQWNGVAIISRVGLDDVVVGITSAPGFPHQEARAVSATCGGVRLRSVYVPNGRVPDSEHYRYKLAWLAALEAMVSADPESTIVCGDFNIAPTDADVFDPEAYVGQTHVTPAERAALAELKARGLHDVVRDRWPDARIFTYWDYRAGMFHQ